MDLETAQTTTTAKLPFLKQGKYDMWRLRIEQYFQVRDYALWDVIENENSFKPEAQTTTNADGSSTTLVSGPITTEEKAQKNNYVKARNNMANKNVPAPTPTRFDDQMLPFSVWVPIERTSVLAIYIQQFWNTLTQEAKTRVYRFQLDEDWFILDANLQREALAWF
ncbi:hypothetical protein Tco_1055279 [Tanacetum coccineum]|uniref:Uncharacterized protein n=1 Tax=Tanacetum coccineum TaxID=301880 RepID=A0ABQ5H121_9ASTR